MDQKRRTTKKAKKKDKIKFFIFLPFLILLMGSAVGVLMLNDDNPTKLVGHIHSDANFGTNIHHIPLINGPGDPSSIDNPEKVIDHIVSLSKEGRIDIAPFTAGKTMVDEVESEWGQPQHVTEVDNTLYEDFPERLTTIGIADKLIVDLRSWGSNVKKVHYNDIIQELGEANETNYYHDNEHDQLILQYEVSSNYQLKWILPKPTNEWSNPAVDHISIVSKQLDDKDNTEQPSDQLTKMSLSEKIGQMIIAGVEGTSLQPNDEKLIKNYHVGGFIFYGNNLTTHQQTKELIQDFQEKNRANPLPLFMSVDQEGGRISRIPGVEEMPTNELIGKRNDPDYAYRIGQKLGQQLNSVGFNLDYAPVMDINSNPNNPVIGDRSYGDNASVVSQLGIQTMLGIQSENIIAVVKHFPGHGDTSVDSHIELPIVDKSLQELNKMELIPFKEAIDSGADVVMVAHILNPNLDPTYPASMSKKVITDILRSQLDFKGVVITDDLTMGAVMNNFGIGDAAVDAIQAGSDIVLVAHDYHKVVQVIEHIKKAVQNGDIKEDRIDESVSRIIELKNRHL
ncbi:beta-N-acetylhexosaminidase [Aquibacillus koreensis]|uniref:beta-N-acetylhexosaminidase n=1 Tax=Aquibacillus koreensis TaxID=279446 RepID=A0A9X3WHN9_9BACI|nr:beta-N-acetylhexosaminidase [Aquibacillus koreensis]MCT2537102.1 beta-N-acetylhexosaminidase [Aquibacillus koreensis]MDC3419915.1 beta-N-acetylhexosaminidase [Aquibacillus koreensis]